MALVSLIERQENSDAKIIQLFPKQPKPSVSNYVPKDQTMEPIWSREDVENLISYCLSNNQWRNALLFVMGFNTGLRISDLIERKINEVFRNGEIVDEFRFIERKKANLKSVKPVTVYVNEALKEMLQIYIKNTPNITPESFLFENYGRNEGPILENGYWVRPSLSRQAAWKIVKKTTEKVGLSGKFGTHSLRKTPALQIAIRDTVPEDEIVKNPMGIQAVQRFLNHSSVQSTYHYLGIYDQQLKSEYMRLNLGLESIDKYRAGATK